MVNMRMMMLSTARWALPLPLRAWLMAKWSGADYRPPVGWVRFGSLRRLTPLSREYGYDRGQPVDRYYIERFLRMQASDVRGRVLEIGDDTYTRQFGADRVTRSDVLHVRDGDPKVTIVADLADGAAIPSAAFDCVILTQTLQLVYDLVSAIKTIHRILKPGGVILATVPGISQISRYDMDRWGHYWSFTSRSVQRLFEEVFPPANVEVEAHGNVLAAISFLHGLARQELRQKDLDYRDPDYELIVTVRAVKG